MGGSMLFGGRDPGEGECRVMVGAMGAVRTHKTTSKWPRESANTSTSVGVWRGVPGQPLVETEYSAKVARRS